MVNANFNNLSVDVLLTILNLDPSNTHLFATTSRQWRRISQHPFFIGSYFRELITSLGQERLNQLFERIDWKPSRASLDELTQKVYQYARTTSFGRELLKGMHGIRAASQLANIVKLRDQEEEDANLVKIAPRLPNIAALYADIEHPEMTEREILSLRAQTIRKAIADMPNRDDVRSLHLHNLGLTSVPKEIFLFTELKILRLNGNQLSTLPKINNLVHLKRLDLGDNQFTTCPSQITRLPQLQYLYLNGNKLTTYPKETNNLANLSLLDLRGNPLRATPPKR